MIRPMKDDRAQRGFFFEKHTQGGSILTGNKIQETPYKFRATPINQRIVVGGKVFGTYGKEKKDKVK